MALLNSSLRLNSNKAHKILSFGTPLAETMSIAELPESWHKPGTDDGFHGEIGPSSPFPPEAGRYHLYIGLFCPFAHRVNLVRHLEGLSDVMEVSVVKPYPKGDANGYPGWCFPKSNEEYPEATVDKIFGSRYLHEIYFRADPQYKGRYSVPMIWDKEMKTIVSNESAEIMRWLPDAFGDATINLYPTHLRSNIDEMSDWMQRDLNTGVYKAGFAPSQEFYDTNVILVFESLNKLEKIIAANGGPYIFGKDLTEVDLRLFATVVRFDTVYVQHFKCNLGTIRHNYPVINNWLKNLYHNVPGFKETTNFKHIKENYTKSHYDINPKAITPLGPIPHVEAGVVDFATLSPGSVALAEES